MKRNIHIALVLVIVLGILLDDVEGRRKILKGRKIVTRRYYKKAAIPAWSIVTLIGLGMVGIGGGVYVGLKKLVLDRESKYGYKKARQGP